MFVRGVKCLLMAMSGSGLVSSRPLQLRAHTVILYCGIAQTNTPF